MKMYMSRAEVLEASGPTSGSHVRVKIGVTNDGKITAAESYLAFEAGAYPGSPIGGATACMLSPYDIENVKIDGYDVVTNKAQDHRIPRSGRPARRVGRRDRH